MSSFKYHYNLCDCGRPKKDTSKHCRICSSADPSKGHSYDICPSCGGPKGKRGKMCRKCRFPGHTAEELVHRPWYGVAPDYSSVPENFARAFAGFFMGEGSIGLGRYKCGVVTKVDIGIHKDDIAVLQIAQSYFGGSLHHFKNRPLVDWRLQGMLPVREFLLLVRKYSLPLATIKLNDVDVMLDYISWRLGQPHHLSADQKNDQNEWRSRMKAVKVRSKL